MGWQRGANKNTSPKAGDTLFMIWDASLGDDLGKSYGREKQKANAAPTPATGHTEHVVVQ